MKDNALPKIKHTADHIWIQDARTLTAIMEQRDPVLNFAYNELESAKLLDVDAEALDRIAAEVQTTIHELQHII